MRKVYNVGYLDADGKYKEGNLTWRELNSAFYRYNGITLPSGNRTDHHTNFPDDSWAYPSALETLAVQLELTIMYMQDNEEDEETIKKFEKFAEVLREYKTDIDYENHCFEEEVGWDI